jgi:hypothetical protein
MKRVVMVIIAAMVLTTLLLSVSGCSVKVSMDTTVKADGSGTIAVRLAADKELQTALLQAAGGLGQLANIFTGEIAEKIPASVDDLFKLILGEIPTEWEVERGADDDGALWIGLTRDFADPEELRQILTESALSKFVDAAKFQLKLDEGFFSTTTVFSTSADMDQAMEEVAKSEPSIPAQMLGRVFSIENRLTLPGGVKENNADEVTGQTLVWHLETSGSANMYAECVSYNWARIIGIAVAGFVVLAGLVALLVILLVRRTHRRRELAAAEQAGQAATTAAVEEGPGSSSDSGGETSL